MQGEVNEALSAKMITGPLGAFTRLAGAGVGGIFRRRTTDLRVPSGVFSIVWTEEESGDVQYSGSSMRSRNSGMVTLLRWKKNK